MLVTSENFLGCARDRRLVLLRHEYVDADRVGPSAERFIRTMLAGWAYGAIYRNSQERTAALDGWLWTYNHRRPHQAIGRHTHHPHEQPARVLQLVRDPSAGAADRSEPAGLGHGRGELMPSYSALSEIAALQLDHWSEDESQA